MFRRTTDLLAIAILLIGGLMVGGRLSEWWSTDASDIPSPMEIAEHEAGTPGDWGTAGRSVTLEFGEFQQALRRQNVRGSHNDVSKILTGWCRNTVQQSHAPAKAPEQSEVRLLTQMKRLPPVVTLPGRGAVYRTDAPMLMVLGTRIADTGTADRKEGTDADAGRVICWGFAFPREGDEWTLFLSGPDAAARRLSPLPIISLPPGCERLLALRSDQGDGMLAFSGRCPLETARQSFNQWFASHGWLEKNPWQATQERWSARFVSSKEESQAVGWRGTVDVQLHSDDGEQLSGLLNFSPQPRSMNEAPNDAATSSP